MRAQDPSLEDTLELPHTGIPRPHQAQPKIPAAKPKARPLPPHHNDSRYWLQACLWRAMEPERIARCTAISVADVLVELRAMQTEGLVTETEGVWVRVVT